MPKGTRCSARARGAEGGKEGIIFDSFSVASLFACGSCSRLSRLSGGALRFLTDVNEAPHREAALELQMLSFSTVSLLAAGLTLHAPRLFDEESGMSFTWFLTNSIFVSISISIFVIWLCRSATRKMLIVPSPLQNAFELVVEGLYDMLEEIVGRQHDRPHVFVPRDSFHFRSASNWFGLLPGVGSIGWSHEKPGAFLSVPHVEVSLLRPTTADLNVTLAMALVFMVLWLYWSLSEVGLENFLLHLFGVKGGLKGFMAFAPCADLLFCGAHRESSRSSSVRCRSRSGCSATFLRGKTFSSSMITLGSELRLPKRVAAIASITIPIPFYFQEYPLWAFFRRWSSCLLCRRPHPARDEPRRRGRALTNFPPGPWLDCGRRG